MLKCAESSELSVSIDVLGRGPSAMSTAPRVSVVTPVYRSKRWLPGYFRAISALDFDETLEVVIIDNDPASVSLEEYQTLAGELELDVISNDANRGFAVACNQGAKQAAGEYLLFLNVDTEIHPQALRRMLSTLEKTPGCAAVEARVEPTEHPKLSWPTTGRVDWCSAACLLIRRSLFLDSNGFDPTFFLYGEDVDLSFRLRDRGYRLLYSRSSLCTHFDDEKSKERQGERSLQLLYANLILRARYSTLWQLLHGFYLGAARAIYRSRGRSVVETLGTVRRAMGECVRVLVERWSERTRRAPRYFPDDGGFSLHARFPQKSDLQESARTSWPDFTIVVATENRDLVVAPLAEALLEQIERLGVGKLIVVDYGPFSGAAEGLLARFSNQLSQFSVLDISPGRIADGLNAGYRAADGDIIIFVDDDVIVDDDFLKRHLLAHDERDVVQGLVWEKTPVAGCPLRKFLRDTRGAVEGAQVSWRQCSTANISIKRAILQEHERSGACFDRALWHASLADKELAWRLARSGHTIRVLDTAGVFRWSVPTVRDFIAERFRDGHASGYALDEHPEFARALGLDLQSTVYPRRFLRRMLAFVFVISPLALPGVLVDLLLPPSWPLNPLATWWYRAFGKAVNELGILWWRVVGRRSQAKAS